MGIDYEIYHPIVIIDSELTLPNWQHVIFQPGHELIKVVEEEGKQALIGQRAQIVNRTIDGRNLYMIRFEDGTFTCVRPIDIVPCDEKELQ